MRLQVLCAARGLTLDQLAERAGVPLATVVHLNASTTRAQPVTLHRLAAALGLAPDTLRDELSAVRRQRGRPLGRVDAWR